MKIRAVLLAALILAAGTTPAKPHNSINPECARALLSADARLNASIDRIVAAGVAGGDDAGQLYERYVALLDDFTSLAGAASGMIHACKR